MRTYNSLSEIEKKLGKPIHSEIDIISSDLRLFYGADHKTSSSYESYVSDNYGSLFEDRRMDREATIRDYLESAELELVRNAAEWGNEGYIDKHVSVTRRYYPRHVVLIVEHKGKGFDYNDIIERNEDIILEKGDIDSARLLTSRSRDSQRRGQLHQARYDEEGGRGMKRLIADGYGEFNYNSQGRRAFYVLPLPKGVKLTREQIKKLKRNKSYKDYLK